MFTYLEIASPDRSTLQVDQGKIEYPKLAGFLRDACQQAQKEGKEDEDANGDIKLLFHQHADGFGS